MRWDIVSLQPSESHQMISSDAGAAGMGELTRWQMIHSGSAVGTIRYLTPDWRGEVLVT